MQDKVLKPVPSAVIQQFLRAIPAFGAAGLMFWGGISSGNAVPWLIGLASLGLGILIATNLLFASMRLQEGVLTSSTLLHRRAVKVADITGIVPFHSTFIWKSMFRDRSHRLPIFDVRTQRGSARIWLNPEVYGEPAIEALIEEIGRQSSDKAATAHGAL